MDYSSQSDGEEYEYEYESSDNDHSITGEGDSVLDSESGNDDNSDGNKDSTLMDNDNGGKNAIEFDGKNGTLKRRKVGRFESQQVHYPTIQMVDSKCIQKVMTNVIEEVAEVFSIPTSAVAPLLRSHRWNKEMLYEAYTTDVNRVMSRAGVSSRCKFYDVSKTDPDNDSAINTSTPNKNAKSSSDGHNSSTCCICFEDDLTPDKMMAMPCGHKFCRECWTNFLTTAINDGPSCIYVTCPQSKCHEVITEKEVREILSPSEQQDLVKQFQTYQLRNYIEMNGNSRWCPGADCDRVASIRANLMYSSDDIIAKCDSCPTSFCIRCGEEPHSPLKCHELEVWGELLANAAVMKSKRNELDQLRRKFEKDKMWMAEEAFISAKAEEKFWANADGIKEKCTDVDSAKWVIGHTKKCPTCKWRIQKNNGCDHMVCQKCKSHFCWACLQSSDNHSSELCHQKRKEEDKKREAWKIEWFKENKTEFGDEAQKALDDLNYFLDCHSHHEKHARVEKHRQKRLQSFSPNWVNFEFYEVALKQLVVCYRLIKHSYAFAYFLSKRRAQAVDEEEKHAFQRSEIQLENHRTTLCSLMDTLQNYVNSAKPDRMDRLAVVNQTRAIDSFLKNTTMLQCIDDDI